jgi:hypothetical protein
MCVPLTRSDYYGASAPMHTFNRRRAYPTNLNGCQEAGTMRNGSRVHEQPIEPPRIFRRENQLRSFLFWKERGNGDGEAAQVIYA